MIMLIFNVNVNLCFIYFVIHDICVPSLWLVCSWRHALHSPNSALPPEQLPAPDHSPAGRCLSSRAPRTPSSSWPWPSPSSCPPPPPAAGGGWGSGESSQTRQSSSAHSRGCRDLQTCAHWETPQHQCIGQSPEPLMRCVITNGDVSFTDKIPGGKVEGASSTWGRAPSNRLGCNDWWRSPGRSAGRGAGWRVPGTADTAQGDRKQMYWCQIVLVAEIGEIKTHCSKWSSTKDLHREHWEVCLC